MNPFLSIVIATYNRAQLLDEAISSLTRQINPATGKVLSNDFEILVIDNASRDCTREVAERWKKKVSNLKYFMEARQGVSYARNRGLVEARGTYLVFMDDECTVHENFVSKLFTVLRDHKPVLFGGPVYPRYPYQPAKPEWFCDKYGIFSSFAPDVASESIWLSGANMGGMRGALSEIGGFSIELGPQGERMVYGEEHELTERMREKFGKSCVRYFSDIAVYHLVRPEKYNLFYNIKEQCLRGYWRGKLSGLMSCSNSEAYVSPVKANKRQLVIDLFKTPFLRDRRRYPYIQNYIIEVIVPFVRAVFVFFGKLDQWLFGSKSKGI